MLRFIFVPHISIEVQYYNVLKIDESIYSKDLFALA